MGEKIEMIPVSKLKEEIAKAMERRAERNYCHRSTLMEIIDSLAVDYVLKSNVALAEAINYVLKWFEDSDYKSLGEFAKTKVISARDELAVMLQKIADLEASNEEAEAAIGILVGMKALNCDACRVRENSCPVISVKECQERLKEYAIRKAREYLQKGEGE